MHLALTGLCLLALVATSFSFQLPKLSFRTSTNAPTPSSLEVRRATSTCLHGVRSWAKDDLNDKDIFDEEGDDGAAGDNKKKQKMKLEKETVFFEGPPSPTEIVLPAISILTVIGIIPFISAVSRQFWVRYKFTSRRVSIQSGFGGQDLTEIIYPDIEEIRFVYRAFGQAGDMVMFLKDGAKVELRHVPNFNEVYQFVLSKCDEECQSKSMKLKPSV